VHFDGRGVSQGEDRVVVEALLLDRAVSDSNLAV
jgi:hypothetical protein